MMKISALLFSLVFSTCAFAGEVTCDFSGPTPDNFEPGQVLKVLKWTEQTERSLKIPVPRSKDEAMRLQPSVVDWSMRVPEGSVDYFFRQALVHGLSVQYENFFLAEDPQNVAKHQFWVQLEAARSDACLSIVSPTH